MKQAKEDKQENDLGSLPERDTRKEHIGRQFSNQWQFEEAVQKLKEEFENHPFPPKGVFY